MSAALVLTIPCWISGYTDTVSTPKESVRQVLYGGDTSENRPPSPLIINNITVTLDNRHLSSPSTNTLAYSCGKTFADALKSPALNFAKHRLPAAAESDTPRRSSKEHTDSKLLGDQNCAVECPAPLQEVDNTPPSVNASSLPGYLRMTTASSSKRSSR